MLKTSKRKILKSFCFFFKISFTNNYFFSINQRSPIFGSLIENIFENTISNILTEAFNKEFSLTTRPRLIALPPKLNSPNLSANANNNNPDSASSITNALPNSGIRTLSNGMTKSNGNFNKSSFFTKTKTGEPSVPISPILSTSELV